MDEIQFTTIVQDDSVFFTTIVQDDSVFSAAEIAETTEAPITTSEISETSVTVDYDMKHIQHNTDGILLMTTGIFFLLVIYLVGKLLGGFLSM